MADMNILPHELRPQVSGFTLIRNGVEFDYPFCESIKSLLPLVNELIINLGVSTDSTKEVLEKFLSTLSITECSKIKIIENEWPLHDATKRRGGRILAEQTNLALSQCRGDWCVYLQADEVLHEKDVDLLRHEIEKSHLNTKVDALVLNYIHFYGSYNVIQQSRSAYRREVRVIRNRRGIASVGDAQGFRYQNGEKIPALLSKTHIYHYGWARPQETMKLKTGFMDTLYHPQANPLQPLTGDNYKFKRFIGLKPFQGSHPAVMHLRVTKAPLFDFSSAPRVFELKDLWKILSGIIESLTGYRPFEYCNYKLVGKY